VSGPTAIVVGGGFVGAACAYRLQRLGFVTTLIDPGDERRAASWGNAGHIATEQADPLASLATLRSLFGRLFLFDGPVGLRPRHLPAWFPFGMRLIAASTPARFQAGRRALQSLLWRAADAWRHLADETGAGDLLRLDGHYCVWESAAKADLGRRSWMSADLGAITVREATAEELAALRTRFAGRPVAAIRFSGTGQVVSLPALRRRLGEAFRDAGGTRLTAVVEAVRIVGDTPRLSLADGAQIDADRVVIAAGIGSAPLLRGIEGHVPLIAERGYHIDAPLAAGDWPADLSPVAFEDRWVVVTRFADTLRMTGFTEFARASARPDPRKWARLERHANALGLPAPADRVRWFGPRPTLPDYLPAIGSARQSARLIYAFGHQHLGLTMAAVTGEIVADLAQGRPPPVPLAPFDLARFG